MSDTKKPNDMESPALQADNTEAPLPPRPVKEPVDRSELRRKLIARFPKTLAYLAK